MTDHDWIRMRGDGWPKGKITPSRCGVCKLVVHDIWPAHLSDHGCPGQYFEKGSLLDQVGGMVPTVRLGPNTSQGVTPERQALLDIVELIDNQYDDLYILIMVDQIAKKVLNENT